MNDDYLKNTDFAVRFSDGEMAYLGEFDATNFSECWEEANAKAIELAEEYDQDTDFFDVDIFDNWLQTAHDIHRLMNIKNKERDSGWYVFEVCMDADDAKRIKQILKTHKDFFLLEELLEDYTRWEGKNA
jgi:hypothetical protein